MTTNEPDLNETEDEENSNENINSFNFDNDNNLEQNNFHCNYQTYRVECSRLMSNDAYEPDSANDNLNAKVNNFDLRTFLRDKAYRKQQEIDPFNPNEYVPTNLNHFNASNANTNGSNLENLDYFYQPITEPITVQKNEFYFNNNNNNLNKKIYYNRKFSSHFGDTPSSLTSYDFNNVLCGVNQQHFINNNTDFNNEETNDQQCLNGSKEDVKNDTPEKENDNDTDDDEEEDFKNGKKLKSIVLPKIINQCKF